MIVCRLGYMPKPRTNNNTKTPLENTLKFDRLQYMFIIILYLYVYTTVFNVVRKKKQKHHNLSGVYVDDVVFE